MLPLLRIMAADESSFELRYASWSFSRNYRARFQQEIDSFVKQVNQHHELSLTRAENDLNVNKFSSS